MATTIYMDKETSSLLEQLRQREPDFNFSQFVKKSLGLEATGKSESQENLIQNRIKEAQLVEQNAIATRELWEQRLISYKAEQLATAEKKNRERQEKEATESYKANLKNREAFLMDYFEKNGYSRYKEGLKDGKWGGTSDFYDVIKNE